MPHNGLPRFGVAPELASGYGIGHSDTSKNPRPLVGITLEAIQALVSAPQSVSKEQAQWVIPSTLMTRRHASQRDEGDFHALWVDIDDNSEGVSVERASEAISEALGGCKVMAYATRSAKPDNLKMRLIVPLGHPCCGEDYVALADVLNDVAEECGLKADRATQRPGQLCFLPNRGEVYAGHVVEGEGFDVLAVSDRLNEKQAAIAQEKRQSEERARAAKVKTEERALAGTLSPIDAFNEAHPLEFVLRGCGYQRCGNRWLSPLSESGAAGVVILEDSNHWFSNHSSDTGIGHESGDGFRGDAFDLFVHFNHVGDRDSAIKEAGSMFTTSDGRTLTQANQDIYREQRKAAPDVIEAANDPGEQPEGMEPVDLLHNMELPDFPLYTMPKSISDYAKDQGELMGVDPGVIALSALAVSAACLDDRVVIQPKRFDPTWTESARLWVAPIGDPSVLKSPGQAKAMAPAKKINADWMKHAARVDAEYKSKMKQWQRKADKGEGDEGPQPEPPYMRRLIYQDVTVEKLGDLLAKHAPRGGLVFNDELSGWLSSMDAYKGGGNKDRSAWLEAFNGGHKHIDRVARGSLSIENWSACVLGGIQPTVIRQYANATNHDGMLQRFILYSARQAKMGVDRYPDMEAKHAYERMLRQVSEVEAGSSPVKLSDGAHAVKEALWRDVSNTVRLHPNKFLAAALGKWTGIYCRLLLTVHAIKCAESDKHPSAETVTQDTAKQVADLMWKCLLPHALDFYAEFDPVEDKACDVANLILAKGWERFTVKRDLDRQLRASRGWKPWEFDETLGRLESFGWIFPVPGKINERGKPSAYTVNPMVHEKFASHAEKERERREKITQMMAEIA